MKEKQNMSKPQNVMLVSIALTAARVCTARAPAQNVSRRRNGPRPETRPTGPRPRHIAPRRDRDVSTETTSLVHAVTLLTVSTRSPVNAIEHKRSWFRVGLVDQHATSSAIS